MKTSWKVLRILAIILMVMTAGMNILGGAGTYCAAFSNNIGYRMAFKELMDYRWIYQALVVTTVLIGIAGVWAVVKLIQGHKNSYRTTLWVLGIGVLLGGIHFFTSLTLRGEATPANVKFFINLLTLLFFLAFLLPGIKEKVNFSQPSSEGEKTSLGGMASIMVGLLTLTVFVWAGPSHMYFGENWVYAWEFPLLIIGTALTVGGFIFALRGILTLYAEETSLESLQFSEHK